MGTLKFQNKYRIASARLQNWDYAREGAYFITICTKDRLHYFGEIENKKMILSNMGVIADLMWHEIKNHAKNITLGEFVVMPNHVHGILILNGGNTDTDGDGIDAGAADVGQASHVETLHATSLRRPTPQPTQPSPPPTPQQTQMAKISPKSNSVSTIIRSYKSSVTKHGNRLGYEFAWQARFHDHIIHNAQEFENIRNYIADNPRNWKKDKFFGNK